MDTDLSKLRSTRDAKGKIPQAYDDSSLFSQCFITQFDCASTGSTIKLKQLLTHVGAKPNIVDDATFWNKNTCLHLATKHS